MAWELNLLRIISKIAGYFHKGDYLTMGSNIVGESTVGNQQNVVYPESTTAGLNVSGILVEHSPSPGEKQVSKYLRPDDAKFEAFLANGGYTNLFRSRLDEYPITSKDMYGEFRK